MNDSKTYLLDSDPTVTFKQNLGQLLELGKGLGFLSPKTVEYLIVDNPIPITPVFHHLSKIHKGDIPVIPIPHCSCVGSLFKILSG